MVSALDRLSYAARQVARVAWYAGHYAAGRRLLKPMPKPDFPVGPTPTRAEMTADMREVFEREWQDIAQGLFPAPRKLSFDAGEFLRRSARYFRDLPHVDARRHGQLDGELPLNTFGGSLSTGRIHGLWHIIEGALQASGRAGERQVRNVNVSFVGASAPIVQGTTFIFVKEPY